MVDFIYFCFIYLPAHRALQVCSACGGQKRESDSLGLKLQQLGTVTWMTGVESGSSKCYNFWTIPGLWY